MREETRICDMCDKIMQRNGPIWYGGTILIKEDYAKMTYYPHDEQIKDICRECMKNIRQILRLPQFDP